MHIAIAGNIGSGKTTLTSLLSQHYNWDAHYEDTQENPYLNDFYEDMQRWSFNLQIFFLQNRFNKIMDYHKGGKNFIQDRTIYEDAYIFAPNLNAMNLLTKRDFDNYMELFNLVNSLIKAPDLLIYLRASVSTLVNQIEKRGREYEENIRLDYLKRLNDYYNKWIDNYTEGPLLVIDCDKIKFGESEEDLGHIISKVDSTLYGLF